MNDFNIDNPCIIEETNDFAVVYKPPKMHCAPGVYGYTLFDWYTANSSRVYNIMHRLDYETHGLVLFARNEKSFLFFKDMQDKGEFIKEYSASCILNDSGVLPEGFPRFNSKPLCFDNLPLSIESYFRPFGPGRRQVRPVIDEGKKNKEIAKDKGNFYKTEIINKNDNNFTIRIKRGFRHQIRCHLCWIGYPILNDPLYVKVYAKDGVAAVCSEDKQLILRSHALFFTNPENGRQCEYRIPVFGQN